MPLRSGRRRTAAATAARSQRAALRASALCSDLAELIAEGRDGGPFAAVILADVRQQIKDRRAHVLWRCAERADLLDYVVKFYLSLLKSSNEIRTKTLRVQDCAPGSRNIFGKPQRNSNEEFCGPPSRGT